MKPHYKKIIYSILLIMLSLGSTDMTANPPTADLGSWKTPCYNCMNYALNLKTALFAQIPAPPPGGHTCASINAFVTAAPPAGLGLAAAPAIIPPATVPVCPPGQCLVALSAGTNPGPLAGDFHWYRRNADGSWSQKHGPDPATDKDDAIPGVPMTDANPPGGGANLGGYTFCGYYCIPAPPNLPATPGVSAPGANAWTVALTHLRIFKHTFSGIIPLPFIDILIGSLAETTLISKLPNTSTPIPDPQWNNTETSRGYGIYRGGSSPSFPPYLKVYNGVVAYYSDLDGTTITYYADNNGIESYLASQFVSNAIPTLSEWGIIILLLFFSAMAMRFIYRRKMSLSFATHQNMNTNNKPQLFNRVIYFNVLAVVLLVSIVLLFASYFYFNGNTTIDIIGTVVSSAILAYMIHLYLLLKDKSH